MGCTYSITVSLRKKLSTSGDEERSDVCICVGVICVWRCSRFSSSHMFLEYIFSSLALPTRCWLHGFPTGWRHCQSGQRLCQVANRFAWMFAFQDSTLPRGERGGAHIMRGSLESPGIRAEPRTRKISQLTCRSLDFHKQWLRVKRCYSDSLLLYGNWQMFFVPTMPQSQWGIRKAH